MLWSLTPEARSPSVPCSPLIHSIIESPDYILNPFMCTSIAPINPRGLDLRPFPRKPPSSSPASPLVPPPYSAPSITKGFGSFYSPSYALPSAWNTLPAHFPHYLILQVSAQRSLPQRSPLGLTPTLPTAPWTSSSYQLPQSVMISLHIFENDCVIDIPLPPLDHGFHEDMHRVYFCLWLYPGANHRARRIIGSQE